MGDRPRITPAGAGAGSTRAGRPASETMDREHANPAYRAAYRSAYRGEIFLGTSALVSAAVADWPTARPTARYRQR
jgi:hypothetical protein